MANAEEQRLWRQNNPGKQSEYNKRYRDKNKIFVLKCVKNWRDNNKDHIKDYNSQYVQENLMSIVTYNRNKRARNRNLEGTHTVGDIKDLLEKQDYKCNTCLIPLDKYDVDHKIPQSKGGSNGPENLQILCPTCNRSKNDKTMEEWTDHKELLKLYG